MGTVTSRPVLVLFHLPAATVPPVVTALPVVKAAGAVLSTVSAAVEAEDIFPAASTTYK